MISYGKTYGQKKNDVHGKYIHIKYYSALI
jgi:hypothetical protein